MNVVYNKRDYILPFKKYLNKPKKSVSFVTKVEFEYTYGKDAYDRKPIENVEQITLRELYELTLSRIEARKSNVYYCNKAPETLQNETSVSDNLNNLDGINNVNNMTEDNKLEMMAEQEKLNTMEIDELDILEKSPKKIKLDNSFNDNENINISTETEEANSNNDTNTNDNNKIENDQMIEADNDNDTLIEDEDENIVESLETDPVNTNETNNEEQTPKENEFTTTEGEVEIEKEQENNDEDEIMTENETENEKEVMVEAESKESIENDEDSLDEEEIEEEEDKGIFEEEIEEENKEQIETANNVENEASNEAPANLLTISTLKPQGENIDPLLISPRSSSYGVITKKEKYEQELKLKINTEGEEHLSLPKVNPDIISPRTSSINASITKEKENRSHLPATTNQNSNEDANENGNEDQVININFNNLPDKLITPRRVDSRNRKYVSVLNSQFDLANYKPPIKPLSEINDPNYEEKVGQEPVPYGSSVFYDEPEITSPNLEHAIPAYHRPMMNYRNTLMNMASPNVTPVNNTYGSGSEDEEMEPIQPPVHPIEKEKEKDKKAKDKHRKSLSLFSMLKKSKSSENISKAKNRMSLFKPISKHHSTPVNNSAITLLDKQSKQNKHRSSPLIKTPVMNNYENPMTNNPNSNITVKPIHNRVSLINSFQEPIEMNEELTQQNPENKRMSSYALKTLKLRQSDSSLYVNTQHLSIPVSPNRMKAVSPISVRSMTSAHSNYSSQSEYNNEKSDASTPSLATPTLTPSTTTTTTHNKPSHRSSPKSTYVPNIPLD